MNHLLRTCKCHWEGATNLHWAHTGERRPFAAPGTTLRFAPDAPVVGSHLHLELHLEPAAERAWGTTTHTCTVHAEQVRTVQFDAVGLEIARVRVNGRRATYEHDGQRVAVRLPRVRKAGDAFTVALEHTVTRPVAGLYFTNPDAAYPERFRTVWSQGQDEDSRYYFPCLDAPRFKQTTEALLYVPRGWFALSNGTLVKRQARAGKGEALWHYRLDVPYSTYLFSVVAGEFAAHRERHRGLEVRWFVQPGREAEGRNAFGNTAAILRFLADFCGVPYPHAQYTQIAVPDFIFGGMENFTVTTQTDLTLHDDRAHADFSSDDLVAHEAAHTWYGNLVTARDWAHAWLHESFATYMEALWAREHEGEDAYQYQLLRDAEAYRHEDGQYRRPLVTQRYEAPIDLFDAHLYPGGAVRLRNLHALVGDRAFRAALGRFVTAHRGDVVETVDFARAIEREAGANHDWWFAQWIHAAGYPALELAFTWKADEKLAEITLTQTAPVTEGDGSEPPPPARGGKSAPPPRWFRLPLTLGLQVGRAWRTVPLLLDGETVRLVLPLERRPRMVVLDPDCACPVRTLKQTKPEDLLLYELEHAPGAVARIEAAATLAEQPSAKVIRALGRRLRREPFWGVQQRIARALGRIGGEQARDALLRAVTVAHPKARREVVVTLGHFRDDPRVAAALERKARRGDASYYVEAELARALGRCRAPGARPLLEAYLGHDSHAEVIRSGAYDGLAELNDPDTLPLLLDGLRYGAPALSRGAAIRAAAELARHHPPLRKTVLDALSAVAEHRGQPAAAFRGKLAALRALVRIADGDGLAILQRVAEHEVDGRLVRLARLCADDLRAALARPQELRSLRTDLDRLATDNKTLRDRVEGLEQRGRPRAAPAAGPGKRTGGSRRRTPR